MKNWSHVSIIAFFLLASCNNEDPLAVLNDAIKGKSFIPYELPMPSTRVGTVLRGDVSEMYLVARPEKCFPDLPGDSAMRWIQPTDLANQYKSVEVGFDAGLNTLLNAGSSTMNLRASATYVKTVELEFQGVAIEFLEESSFMDYYKDGMSSTCKALLEKYPFIGQGLRVEGMKFVFKDSEGGAINLVGRLSQIADISAGVNWRIVNNFTLVIDTPKYIGYRMAKLVRNGKNTELQYASKAADDGSWIFKSLNKSGMGVRGYNFTGAPNLAEPLELLP